MENLVKRLNDQLLLDFAQAFYVPFTNFQVRVALLRFREAQEREMTGQSILLLAEATIE